MYSEYSLTADNSIIKKKRVFYFGLKRLFDIIVSFVSLIILLPLFIIVSILIKIDSQGPIILKQVRIGKHGKPFVIYKFRSMIDNAEQQLAILMKENKEIAEEYSKNKKLKNDPRITKIGKIIRKTSIDELPQLINVLKGEMSIVGPRPYFYGEVPDMGGYYNYIRKMTPGLTGLWQVSGRSDCSFIARCKLDAKYYQIRNIKVDLNIIFKTFKVVFLRKGAK